MQFDINKHVLPREIKLEKRLIEVDWSPIVNNMEDIEKILVTLKDVTEVRSLQLKSIEQAQDFAKLGEVAQHDAEKMLGFFSICMDLFKSSLRNLNTSGTNNAMVFRNLHTIKGLSRNFQFQRLTESVHEAEQILKENQNQHIDEKLYQQIRVKIDMAIEIFKEYERINNNVLGRQHSHDQVVVLRKDLQEIHNLISHATGKDDIREVETKILFLFESRLEQVIADEVNLLNSLCQKLGKPVPIVNYNNDKFIIPTDKKSLLRKVFVHLLRNSIDHGIEAEEERLQANKPAKGTITCSMSEIDNGVKINYRDDGRGLNLLKIREKGLQKGFFKSDAEASALDIATLIFEAGFSTATEVTEISGRGVGMDAVRNFLLENGSNIVINLESQEISDHVPFSFDIYLDLFGHDSHAEAG
ncbi:MAG: ATP-binding protein [Oligoflexus sp.]